MITREEYELLIGYRALGYKWIAREKNGLVYAHKYKPFKDDPFWLANGLAYTIVSTPTGNIFKSITWEDEKPTKIDDLIRDYESHRVITGGNNLNKAELMKEIEGILDDIGVSDYQLGECDEDTIWTISSITIRDIVSAIEKHSPDGVKATVPQFVADWIEKNKGIYTLRMLFSETDMPNSVRKWTNGDNYNCNLMAKAWLYGYKVEKEKLYIVELPNRQRLAKIDGGIKFYDEREWFEKNLNTKLTRAEIESIDPILMGCTVEVE